MLYIILSILPVCHLVYSHAMYTRHMDPRRKLSRVLKAPEAAIAQSQHGRRARAVLHTVDGGRGRGFTPQRRQVIRFSSRLCRNKHGKHAVFSCDEARRRTRSATPFYFFASPTAAAPKKALFHAEWRKGYVQDSNTPLADNKYVAIILDHSGREYSSHLVLTSAFKRRLYSRPDWYYSYIGKECSTRHHFRETKFGSGQARLEF